MPSKIFSFNPKINKTTDNPSGANINANINKNQAGLFGGLIHMPLYRKNLTRFWPLWFMASLTVLFPLSMMNSVRYGWEITAARLGEIYYGAVSYIVPVVMLGYAILCAMCVWGYLYNARSVGMMHSLPIRRESLFVTNFISGLTMIIIPCVITGAACVIMSLVCGAFDAKILFTTVLCVAGEGFFYFATATAAAFLTGHIAALPLLYFFFHFLQWIVDCAISIFATGMIFGLSSPYYTRTLGFLSPTIYLIEHIEATRTYEDTPFLSPSGDYYTNRVLTAIKLNGAGIIALYALAGIAFLYIAWLLYKSRRSECAGDVIAMNWGKPVFQYGITALTAIGGGQIVYVILVNSIDGESRYALVPMILCMIFAGALGYYATAMMLAKSLRVFTKQSLRGLGAVALGCVIFTSALYFDIFGIGRRVPDDSQTGQITFRVDGNNYYFTPGQNDDDDLIARVRNLHRAIIDDREYIIHSRPLNFAGEVKDDSEWDWASVTFVYKLKNGKTLERYYPLYLLKTRVQTPGTVDYMLTELVNSREMKYRRLLVGHEDYILNNGYLSLQRRETTLDLNSREAARLWEAVQQDAGEGTWGDASWFRDESGRYAMQLQLRFRTKDPVADWDSNSYSYDSIQIRIYSGMRHTIQCLRDLDLVEDDDFITMEELNKILRQREDDDEREYATLDYYDWDEAMDWESSR